MMIMSFEARNRYWDDEHRVYHGIPYDDRGHLDGARVEVISCKRKLPAFPTRSPTEGPLSCGILDEVSAYAKKDRNVKKEAKECGYPFHHVFQTYLLDCVIVGDPAPKP